ncbi:MAG: TAXI family TRAP transporter solute-binding subunit [Alphaproteobacteria bacterium]|nr:TAXI family TRAP transporter solute-binding subunit [Alphaproteobacteria bacterium]
MIMKRRSFMAAAGAAAIAGTGLRAAAQQQQFFRIGTGGTGGTYFPVGGMIANAISEASGHGVKGLVATAVASNGSLANINAINGGQFEAGLSQADVAYWAWSGTGLFEGRPKIESVRFLANLYPESIQIVVRRGASIRNVADLKGKRVSLDEPGSGTLVDARIVLAAYGLSEKDVRPEYLKMGPAADRMKDGALDAFFTVGGWPTGAIAELASSQGGIDLLPVDGPQAEKLLQQYTFFSRDVIPAEAYKGSPETKTIAVGAQLVTSAKIPDELVYGITKALWHDETRKLLDAGHAKGKLIRKETALDGAGIPLHPGAERFYREVGLLK